MSCLVNDLSYVLSLSYNPTFQVYAAIMGFVYYLELINWFYAVKHVDVSVASSTTTPWPVVTIVLAILFLQEAIKNYQVITMILTLISVYGLLLAGKIKISKLKNAV